jgi:radical SAM protein with 4Fe4S-binding SPASM domain
MKQRGEWLEIEEWIQLGRWIEKDLQKRISIPLFYSWPMAFHGIRRLLDNRSGLCNIEHILGVLATGNLAMCGIGTQEKDLVYGQLGLDKVGDIWMDHPALLKMRTIIRAPREGICQSCLHQKLCKGHCLAQNYYAGKRLTAPFWFCQMADQSHLFPLTRKYDKTQGEM